MTPIDDGTRDARPADRAAPFRDADRAVLLASSGELPWWRGWRLSRRLRRDAEAARLAETLLLVTLALRETGSPRRRMTGRAAPRPGLWIRASLAAAACLALAFAAWRLAGLPSVRPPTAAVPLRVAGPAGEAGTVSTPSLRLLLAALDHRPPVMLLASVEPPGAGSAPVLPPWSRDRRPAASPGPPLTMPRSRIP